MHAVVSKRDLARVLARCQGVADKKSTMPVLGNVLVEARKSGELGLAATDLYLAVSGSIPGSGRSSRIRRGGRARLFERVEDDARGQHHADDARDGAVTMRAQGQPRRYTLHGMPGSEFSALPQPGEGAAPMSLAHRRVSQLIASTHFSISADETRPHLNSALFEWDGRSRAHGHDRRSPPLEDGGCGARAAKAAQRCLSRSRASASSSACATRRGERGRGRDHHRRCRAAPTRSSRRRPAASA